MAIRGDLLSADLSNVFQMLALNRKGGRLTVQDQANLLHKRRLYVNADRVALHEAAPERPLEALLVEMGVLSYDQYRDVLARSARYGTDPERLLRQMGILDDAEMDRVRERVAEEGVLEVFLWRNITFELDEQAEPPADDTPYFGIDHLIMESARRQDEWSQFVETPGVDRQIFIRSGESLSGHHADLDAVPHIVLDHVDGVRGSPEIVEQTGLPRYFVDLSLSGLHEAGYIGKLGLSELMSTGDRLVERGRHASALRLFRTALQFDRRNLMLHGRLARAYLVTGRLAKSAAHHRFCALNHLAAGRRREALAIYQTVLEMLPTDFRTLERCLELLSEEGSITNADDERVYDSARKLLDFYLDTNRDEEALVIVERLRLLGDDEELVSVAARLLLRTGQTEKAAKALLSQARSRQEAGDLDGAADVYRTLFGVDRSNRHLYRVRIAEIKHIQETARRRRRRARVLLATAFVAMFAAFGYAAYAFAAASELSRLPDTGPIDVAAARRRVQRLGAVKDAYPLTLSALEAGRRIQRVREWTRRVNAREGARTRESLQSKALANAEAGRAFASAVGLMERGDLAAALERLGEAISTVDAAGADWAPRSLAAQHLHDIQAYVEEGEALLVEGRDAWEAGDLATAHATLKKVIETYLHLPVLRVKTLEVPVRIVAFPPGARIDVSTDEGPVMSGTGQLTFGARHDRLLTVNVSMDGQVSVVHQLDPERSWKLAIVLVRAAGTRVTVEEPLAALHPLPEGRMVLVARNGKVGFMEMHDDHARTWERGATLLSVQSYPAIGPSGVLVAAESGLLRLVDRLRPRQLWQTRLRSVPNPRAVLPPVALGSEFVVGAWGKGGEGTLARLSGSGGRLIWEAPCRGPIRSIVANPRGVAVIDGEGALHLIDPATGERRRKIVGPFDGAPSTASDGRLLAHKAGEGVLSMTWDGSNPRVALSTSGAIIGCPLDFGGTIVAAHGDGLAIGRGDDVVILSVGIPVAGLVDGPSLCAVRLEDGHVLVIDPSSRTIRFAVRGSETGNNAVIALTRTHLALGAGPRELLLVPLN